MKLIILLSLLIFFISPTLVYAQSSDIVITNFPSVGYVNKTHPYLLECTALNALSILFRCQSKWIVKSRQKSEQVNEGSRLKLKSSVLISKADLADDEFMTCQCYATGSNERTIRSESAKIALTYLRKHFVQTTPSQRIREGSTVALACVPPEGDPRPSTQWFKDGVPFVPDGNAIVASDGSLLLSSARLSHQGVYVCEASNLAGRRVSPPSTIHIYVDGGWSEWSEWAGRCSVDCGDLASAAAELGAAALPALIRSRLCNNPAPLNGGLACRGNEEERKSCHLTCILDGGWTGWSEWGPCTSECVNSRRRSCSHPSPLNGGSICSGHNNHTRPCISGICAPSSSWTERMMLASLLAVILLLIVIAGGCLLLARRSSPPATAYGSVPVFHSEGLKSFPYETSGTIVDSPFGRSTTLRSSRSAYARCESGFGASESRIALLPDGTSSTISSARKGLLRTSSSLSEEKNYATVYDCPISSKFVNEMACERVVATKVDMRGVRLSMNSCSTTLLVAEGCFASPTLVFLTAQETQEDIPHLPEHEILLSPILSVGNGPTRSPPSLPFVLSMAHCASNKDEWELSVYADRGWGWKEENSDGESIHLHVDPHVNSLAHCITFAPCRILLTGRPLKENSSKRMRIAVFAPKENISDYLQLEVLIVPEGMGVQVLKEEERSSRLLCESPGFLLSQNGSLCVSLEDLEGGFHCEESYLEMSSEEHDWCSSGCLHFSFTIQVSTDPTSFTALLRVNQKDSCSLPESLHIRLHSDYEEVHMEEETSVSIDFCLPGLLRDRLRQLLDLPSERDWRSLARSLRASSFCYFGSKQMSPMTALLWLWEARREEPCHLAHALRLSGRPDAAVLVENFISS